MGERDRVQEAERELRRGGRGRGRGLRGNRGRQRRQVDAAATQPWSRRVASVTVTVTGVGGRRGHRIAAVTSTWAVAEGNWSSDNTPVSASRRAS